MLDVQRTLDFGNARRAINLPDGLTAQEPATVAQLNAAVEGLKDKVSCRVSSQGNINVASPGASIDGVAMALNDRVLVRAQTAAAENGIYLWNGASVTMTRSLDANTAAELSQAITTVESGTDAGITYRQTVSGATLEVTALNWIAFGTVSPVASETVPGIIEIATQAETDAGTDTNRAITPEKLAASVYAARKLSATIGDGSATSYTVTHNFNTRDVHVEVYRNSGNYDTVIVEVQRTSANAVIVLFDPAPAVNAYRVLVRA